MLGRDKARKRESEERIKELKRDKIKKKPSPFGIRFSLPVSSVRLDRANQPFNLILVEPLFNQLLQFLHRFLRIRTFAANAQL